MKAIICNKPGEFEKIELEDPIPLDGEIIVRIKKLVSAALIIMLTREDSHFLLTLEFLDMN